MRKFPPPPTRFAAAPPPLQAKAACPCCGQPPGPPIAAWRPTVTAQRASEAVKGAGHFLWSTSGSFINSTTRNVMEVQSTFIDGKLVVAANEPVVQGGNASATGGDAGGWYTQAMDTKLFGFQRDKHTFEKYHLTATKKIPANITLMSGTLHAEQQLLLTIARKIRAGTTAGEFVVMGTKRPCSVCHRVLRAFASALGAHYPNVHLHYVDRTGADTNRNNIGVLNGALQGLKNNDGQTFDQFVDQYITDWGAIPLAVAYDGVVGENNGVRTNAVPKVTELT